MNPSFSDYLALAALFVSVASFFVAGASAFYAKQQKDVAKASSRNDHRNYLAEHHRKYRTALIDVIAKHRSEVERLQEVAGHSLTLIISVFDDHDSNIQAPRRLRHLVHETAEMVFCSFKGQLIGEYGLSIASSWHRFAALELNLSPKEDHFGGNFRRELKEAFFQNPYGNFESMLLNDEYFCGLFYELQRRIDPEKFPVVFAEVQHHLSPFLELFELSRSSFGESAKQLSDLMRSEAFEQFRLHESEELYALIKYKKATLEVLSSLGISSMTEPWHQQHCLSVSIYICSILHAVQDFQSWGWRYNELAH